MANFEHVENLGGSANTSATDAAEKLGAAVYAPDGEGLQFDPDKVPNQEGGTKSLYEDRHYDEQQELFDEQGAPKDLDTKGPFNADKGGETNDNPSVGQPEQQKKMAPDENGNYPNDSEGENESADDDFTRLKKKLREEADQQERDRELRRRLEELVCPGAPKAKIINDSIMFDAME